MHAYTTINPRVFIEKYLREIYGVTNPYYMSLVVHFVFTAPDSSLKLSLKNSSNTSNACSYFLYDFASGGYEYFEEGVAKVLYEHFPATIDPLEIFFSNFNNELSADYSEAQAFMHRVTTIERDWHSNSLVRSLHHFEKLRHALLS